MGSYDREMDNIHLAVEKMRDEIKALAVDLSAIKVKLGVYSAVIGVVVSTVVSVLSKGL